jgi:phosphoglycerate dehydrogenase-like enzyme
MGNAESGEFVKVLWPSTTQHISAYEFLKNWLKDYPNIIVHMCHPSEVEKEMANTHVLIPLMAKVSRSLMEKSPYLALIQQYGVDIEGVDVEAAKDMAIPVCNVPSKGTGHAESVAEIGILLALCCLRDMNSINAAVKSSRLGEPMGRTLLGARCFIYGFGDIGLQLAVRLRAFSPAYINAVRGDVDQWADDLGTAYLNSYGGAPQVEGLSHGCDVVFICMPLTESNHQIIDTRFLNNLSKDAILINVSQGLLLNNYDVLSALQRGQISAVGLDVFSEEPMPNEHPLISHPRCYVTPHIGNITETSLNTIGASVADNIIRLIDGEELRHCANC